jgi:hypothetical protein
MVIYVLRVLFPQDFGNMTYACGIWNFSVFLLKIGEKNA